MAEILLAADEDDRVAGTEMHNLGDPLVESANTFLVLSKEGSMRDTFSWTFSSESGESMAKQIRMTWESGYESGRRRS